MHTSQTIDKWYLVQLTDLVAIGSLSSGREVVTTRVLYIDFKNKILATDTRDYKLGRADKIWINSREAMESLRKVYLVMEE